MFRFSESFRFHASRQLVNLPADDPRSRLNGATFNVTIEVEVAEPLATFLPRSFRAYIAGALDRRHLLGIAALDTPRGQRLTILTVDDARGLAPRTVGLLPPTNAMLALALFQRASVGLPLTSVKVDDGDGQVVEFRPHPDYLAALNDGEHMGGIQPAATGTDDNAPADPATGD